MGAPIPAQGASARAMVSISNAVRAAVNHGSVVSFVRKKMALSRKIIRCDTVQAESQSLFP